MRQHDEAVNASRWCGLLLFSRLVSANIHQLLHVDLILAEYLSLNQRRHMLPGARWTRCRCLVLQNSAPASVGWDRR